MQVAMTRRDLLRLGAAGVAGTVFLGDAVQAAATGRTPASSSLLLEVQDVSREYGVPVAVLLAMGYANTRLEMPAPAVTSYREGDPEGRGVYGVMALVRNPAADTVGLASRITGLSPRELIFDRTANLRGGAALLVHSQGATRPPQAREWLGAVAGTGGDGPVVEATSGVGGGDLYADQVADVLARGFSIRTSSGERLELEGQEATGR
ncbi:MAG: hypothetical protein M3252_09020 [Actinomycetota bacterium]|nr:hypothetical protein [Actinomycetota bacterium]